MTANHTQSWVQKLLVELRALGAQTFRMCFYGHDSKNQKGEFWLDNELVFPCSLERDLLWGKAYLEIINKVDTDWYDCEGGKAVIDIDIPSGKVSVRVNINTSMEYEYDYGT